MLLYFILILNSQFCRDFPHKSATVTLKCAENKKSKDDAEFEVLDEDNGVRKVCLSIRWHVNSLVNTLKSALAYYPFFFGYENQIYTCWVMF